MDIYIGFSLQIYVIQVRRKPTENLQKTYKKSGNGILFICLIANCEICGTKLLQKSGIRKNVVIELIYRGFI